MQVNERDLVFTSQGGKATVERLFILVPIETILQADIEEYSCERWKRTEGLNLRLGKQR